MSRDQNLEQIRLAERLRQVELEFEQEMRARGFNPAQHESLALTGTLAKLYTEREQLRDSLEKENDVEDREAE